MSNRIEPISLQIIRGQLILNLFQWPKNFQFLNVDRVKLCAKINVRHTFFGGKKSHGTKCMLHFHHTNKKHHTWTTWTSSSAQISTQVCHCHCIRSPQHWINSCVWRHITRRTLHITPSIPSIPSIQYRPCGSKTIFPITRSVCKSPKNSLCDRSSSGWVDGVGGTMTRTLAHFPYASAPRMEMNPKLYSIAHDCNMNKCHWHV